MWSRVWSARERRGEEREKQVVQLQTVCCRNESLPLGENSLANWGPELLFSRYFMLTDKLNASKNWGALSTSYLRVSEAHLCRPGNGQVFSICSSDASSHFTIFSLEPLVHESIISSPWLPDSGRVDESTFQAPARHLLVKPHPRGDLSVLSTLNSPEMASRNAQTHTKKEKMCRF